jgi:hypothetical protein
MNENKDPQSLDNNDLEMVNYEYLNPECDSMITDITVEDNKKDFFDFNNKSQNGFAALPSEDLHPIETILDNSVYKIGSKYDGDTNIEGKPHGKGKITYLDGSTYEGEFNLGLKQG